MRERILSLHASALAGESIQFEAPAMRRDGKRSEHEVRGVPIMHQGRPHVLYIGRDLVITDQSMPRLTGLALAGELARLRPGLPVILYTGFGEDLAQKALDDACVAALARKPIEPAELFALLGAHLPVR